MSACLLGSDGFVALGRDQTAEWFHRDISHGPMDAVHLLGIRMASTF